MPTLLIQRRVLNKEDEEVNVLPPEYIEFAWFKDTLKILVGQYISKWKKYQYEIIETFIRMSVFDKKELKKEYLEEIMNFRSLSKYLMQLERYMRNKKMLKYCYKSETKVDVTPDTTKTPQETTKGDKTTKDLDDEDNETLIHTDKCEFKVEQESYEKKIIWMTNKGKISYLKP